ncbi:gametocyte-specific factor 1 homolog isoform X1 [Chrysoperla carnea]|uniref:gametocyte-specific factor 1 homolog isoform X1 n=2 Tax=Chrysoperla carnea TaxID=189513 RepID=UPI001D07A240|nr:gametocyte-specific factor 1 homolog isoform X1 [Chrysoperla carnea]
MSKIVPAVHHGLEAKFIECPYNKSHQILPDRMQVHLVRCRRSHPDEMKVPCPFNSTHVVGQCELEYHIANCPDQKTLVSQLIEYESEERIFEPIPIINTDVECSENWDDVNVPTYDPTEHLENNIIIRNMQVRPPSERKAFREQENRRIEALKDRNRDNAGRKDNASSMNESKVATFRRPNTVSVTKKATTAANNAWNEDHMSQTSTVQTAISTGYDSSDVEVTSQFGNMTLKNTNDGFITVPSRKKSNMAARGRGKRNPLNCS